MRPSQIFECTSKLVLLGVMTISGAAIAGVVEDILQGYYEESKKIDPNFRSFDPANGKVFYHAAQIGKDGNKISCAKCHMADPKATGQTPTGKKLDPMAVVVNPKRFTDSKKVEKWFKRNCMDVYQRVCTPIEKGNFILYLQTVK